MSHCSAEAFENGLYAFLIQGRGGQSSRPIVNAPG